MNPVWGALVSGGLVLAVAQDSRTRSFQIGEASYRVAAPTGYCFFEGDAARSRRRDLEMDESVVVHVMVMDCNWIDRLNERVGGFVSYGYWMTPRAALSQNRAEGRQAFIAELAALAGEPQVRRRTQASQAEFARELERATSGLRIGGGTNLGVIDEDEFGLYMAQIQSLNYLGNQMTIAGVVAITLVDAKVLYYQFYDVFTGPRTIIGLHDLVKADVRRFVQRNEGAAIRREKQGGRR